MVKVVQKAKRKEISLLGSNFHSLATKTSNNDNITEASPNKAQMKVCHFPFPVTLFVCSKKAAFIIKWGMSFIRDWVLSFLVEFWFFYVSKCNFNSIFWGVGVFVSIIHLIIHFSMYYHKGSKSLFQGEKKTIVSYEDEKMPLHPAFCKIEMRVYVFLS